jgi:hypothetical protein
MAVPLWPVLTAISNGVTYRVTSSTGIDPDKVYYTVTIGSGTVSGTYQLRGAGADTYSFSVSGVLANTVRLYEISSYGWSTSSDVHNPGRDFAWLRGDDGNVYKISLDQTSPGVNNVKLVAEPTDQLRGAPEIEAFVEPSDDFTAVQKANLKSFAQPTGPVIELSDSTVGVDGRVLAVKIDTTTGLPVVYQKPGKAPTTQPLYLYRHSDLVVDVDQEEAIGRWDDRHSGVDVAQRATSGALTFTNSEIVSKGIYRLILDVGNIGEIDSGFNGYAVEVSLGNTTLSSTLLEGQIYRSSDAPRVFAFMGDFGDYNTNSTAVANLIKGWMPNDIFAVGDGDYIDNGLTFEAIDLATGKNYFDYIYPYHGIYGANNLSKNHFWMVPGNHDWGNPSSSASNPTGLTQYYQFYLDVLPGNKRYYDVVRGDIHFFGLDSDNNEPDGRTSTSVQAQWLKARLSASTSRWKVVFFHHSPYSSEDIDHNITEMRWPFKAWGADLVISAHSHSYERLNVDGLTYVVVGTGGGNTLRPQTAPLGESLVRIDDKFGALRLRTTTSRLIGEFIDVDKVVQDSFEMNTVRGESVLEFTVGEDLNLGSSAWTLSLNWTNDQDLSSQGFQRTLAVYGYQLYKLSSTLYKITIDPDTGETSPLIASLEGLNDDGNSFIETDTGDTFQTTLVDLNAPGGWLVRYNSNGTVAEWVHESEIYPKNDTFQSKLPLADILTGSTEDRSENLLLKELAGGSLVPTDPSAPAAPTIVSITGQGSADNVGETLSLSASTTGTGLIYTWLWWDGTTTVSTSNTVNRYVNRAGTISYSLTVVDSLGKSATSSTSSAINHPPSIISITISKNDGVFPYSTTLTASVDDVESGSGGVTTKWYEGITLLHTGTSFSYSATQPTTIRLEVSDPDGGLTTYNIEIRGDDGTPPSVAIQANLPSIRIGTSQVIRFTALAHNPDPGNLVFLWTLWDGSNPVGTIESVGISTDGNYRSILDVNVSSFSPGFKTITVRATNSSTLLYGEVQTQVELLPNLSPLIFSIDNDAIDNRVVAGNTVTFSATAADPEGDFLTYSWNFTQPSNLTLTGRIPASIHTVESITVALTGTGLSLTGALALTPIKPGSVMITSPHGNTRDNGIGGFTAVDTITGGTVDYQSGAITVNFSTDGDKELNVEYLQVLNEISGALTVTDALGAASTVPFQTMKIVGGIAISSSLYVTTTLNSDFVYEITAVGTPPFSYAVTSALPTGLTFSNGVIQGKPTVVGTTDVTIKATGVEGTDTKTLRIAVLAVAAARPLPPQNLQVFNDGVNPTYTTGQDLPIRWSIVAESDNLLPTTILEFRTTGDLLKLAVEVGEGVDNYTLTNAVLAAAFLGEPTIKIYAYHRRAGLTSASWVQLTVTKV